MIQYLIAQCSRAAPNGSAAPNGTTLCMIAHTLIRTDSKLPAAVQSIRMPEYRIFELLHEEKSTMVAYVCGTSAQQKFVSRFLVRSEGEWAEVQVDASSAGAASGHALVAAILGSAPTGVIHYCMSDLPKFSRLEQFGQRSTDTFVVYAGISAGTRDDSVDCINPLTLERISTPVAANALDLLRDQLAMCGALEVVWGSTPHQGPAGWSQLDKEPDCEALQRLYLNYAKGRRTEQMWPALVRFMIAAAPAAQPPALHRAADLVKAAKIHKELAETVELPMRVRLLETARYQIQTALSEVPELKITVPDEYRVGIADHPVQFLLTRDTVKVVTAHTAHPAHPELRDTIIEAFAERAAAFRQKYPKLAAYFDKWA